MEAGRPRCRRRRRRSRLSRLPQKLLTILAAAEPVYEAKMGVRPSREAPPTHEIPTKHEYISPREQGGFDARPPLLLRCQ